MNHFHPNCCGVRIFIHREEETEAVGIEAWKAAPVGRRCSAFSKPTEGTSSRPRARPPEDNDPEEDAAELCPGSVAGNDIVPSPVPANGRAAVARGGGVTHRARRRCLQVVQKQRNKAGREFSC